MQGEEFYRQLTDDELETMEDGMAEREKRRRELRESLKEAQSFESWVDNPDETAENLSQVMKDLREYGFDLESDFDQEFDLSFRNFTRMVEEGHSRAAERYAEILDLDEEQVGNVLRMNLEAYENHKHVFATAD